MASIGWPLPAGMTESMLEALLFPPLPAPQVKRPEPDWAMAYREMGHMTDQIAVVAGYVSWVFNFFKRWIMGVV